MVRKLADCIADALHEIAYLRKLLSAHSRTALLEDETLNNAMVYSLLKLTEACRHFPAELTDLYPAIAWRAVTGFGNRLRHEYFALADERVLQVAETELDALEAALKENCKI
ncbi:MAG: DUF86 domain-containing protein [Alphaproteobacteria bacterium]|nr:DUF86 domain-containing protein [Alphaproteobacteria bacterium]